MSNKDAKVEIPCKYCAPKQPLSTVDAAWAIISPKTKTSCKPPEKQKHDWNATKVINFWRANGFYMCNFKGPGWQIHPFRKNINLWFIDNREAVPLNDQQVCQVLFQYKQEHPNKVVRAIIGTQCRKCDLRVDGLTQLSAKSTDNVARVEMAIWYVDI